jgi:hypothetical protein
LQIVTTDTDWGEELAHGVILCGLVCEHHLPNPIRDKVVKNEIIDPLMEQCKWNF